MPQVQNLDHVPYEEHYAMLQTLRTIQRQVAEQPARLCGMVAFGELVRTGKDPHIDLLQIIEGWSEKREIQVPNTDDLRFRGHLRLFTLTPQEFADPEVISDEGERLWVKELLARVKEGYYPLYEAVRGCFRQAFGETETRSALTSPPSGAVTWSGPLVLPTVPRR